jgi:hypothetical protein
VKSKQGETQACRQWLFMATLVIAPVAVAIAARLLHSSCNGKKCRRGIDAPNLSNTSTLSTALSNGGEAAPGSGTDARTVGGASRDGHFRV